MNKKLSVSPETVARIRELGLRFQYMAHSRLLGLYRSMFHGRGLIFSSVRPYETGDDVRHMDWKVMARTGDPYTRTYEEERALRLLLVCDNSSSMATGNSELSKHAMMTTLAGVLSMAALGAGDRVGMLVFGDTVETYLPPGSGEEHIFHLLYHLSERAMPRTQSNLEAALHFVTQTMNRRTIVILLSDFLIPLTNYRTAIERIHLQHDIVAMCIQDSLSRKLPNVGLLPVEDSETGRQIWLDTVSTRWRRQANKALSNENQIRETFFRQTGIPYLTMETTDDVEESLLSFFYRYS